ncbi:hypothetical protein DPMN_175460 [Dreissena polymorpha]|uniref:Uncharacterized protein n=1 Tax=Dreissena polymorpha TaxID=45954 RepID=A0A9D4E876_DREPO|nr:hypothetical protein DPMN_175460 [Dreissena polymorpha]
MLNNIHSYLAYRFNSKTSSQNRKERTRSTASGSSRTRASRAGSDSVTRFLRYCVASASPLSGAASSPQSPSTMSGSSHRC